MQKSGVSRRLDVASRLMVPVILGVFAVPFIVLALYSLPATDDFCKASLSFGQLPQRQHGVLAVTWLYYTQWSPRWVTTLLQSTVMSHVDLAKGYGALLLIVSAANMTALWYWFRTILGLRRATALLVAGVFYATYVASLADLPQELYWLTGAIEYNLSFSTLLILVALLYKCRHSRFEYGAIVLLSVIIPAQHEIAGTFLCLLLVAALVWGWREKRSMPQLYLSLTAASLSMLVVVLAPGNAIRAAQEHRHMWDISHLPRWVAHAFYHGLTWPAYPAILVGGFSMVLLCQADREKGLLKRWPGNWVAWAGVGAMFLVLAESAFVEIATGVWWPYRVMAWFEFMFWLFFACVIFRGVPEFERVRFSLSTKIGVYALLGVTLLGSANFRAAVSDLRGPVEAWWRVDHRRLMRRSGNVRFDPVGQYPNLTFHQNLSADPGCFVNVCMANYLGAKSVVVEKSNEDCPH
jgi:Family of unknown function (DUF6056)